MDKQRVLLVDDDQDILDLVKYNLEKEGFEVETADNGKEGVKRAKEFLPELILLDVMMPEM
ncbi:MAG: two-component system alkaline phosphatase synthesis response regulator PhoP, partial [Flavobacteriales bacterium]